ncbi:MAG TPA: hypothetical protein VH253_20480 [Phycisphaerae bacterium]|nr:hypothetical protein [Phycisphaerae bacterium]
MSYIHDLPGSGWTHAADAPEVRLPDPPPLALTGNFLGVLLLCAALLITIPIIITWLASLFLT